MGVYMGIFNFFITFPQIVNGIIGGPIVANLYGNQAIWAIVTAGVAMIIAALLVVFVEDKDDLRV
jgi:maltose/moltooligosaccharide transporter